MTLQPRIEEKTLSASDLDVLLPQNTTPDAFTTQWGTITEVGPLRVKIDGLAEDEDSAVHSTLDDTVTTGERVLCLLSGTQLIILGRVSDDDVDTALARASASPATSLELPTAVDLNDYITAGYYTQNSNAEAVAGTNYPEPLAGLLEVFTTSSKGPLTYEEMGRNYALDPRATAWVANGGLGWGNQRGYGSGGGSGTYTLVTGAVDGPVLSDGTTKLATYARKTWTAVGTGLTSLGFEHTKAGLNGYPIVPLDPYAISSFVRSSADYGDGISSGAQIAAAFYNAAGTLIAGADVGSPYVILDAGVWTRISIQFVVPATATFMIVVTDIEGMPPTLNMTLDGTGLLVEKEAALEDYYDGSYALSAEVPAMWTGAVNASESILRVVATEIPSMVWQRYTPYGAFASRIWVRCYYNAVWHPWYRYQATNAVTVRAQITTEVVMGAGFTRVDGWTQLADNRNAFNATTGVFIVPETGVYMLNVVASSATGTTRRFITWTTGTAAAGSTTEIARIEGPATGYAGLTVTTEEELAAGTQIQVEYYCASALNLRGDFSPIKIAIRRVE